MKKIPTLFKREFENGKIKAVLPEFNGDMENVLINGTATVKWDGSCCAVIGGKFYKRYDAKKGKPVPAGAIKCQEEADPVTGHLPCWVECDRSAPADKWFWAAYDNYSSLTGETVQDGTYEAVGCHFNGDPYGIDNDILKAHGKDIISVERSFEAVREYLENNNIEGIVFWLDGEPRAKIKRSDFNFPWNKKSR